MNPDSSSWVFWVWGATGSSPRPCPTSSTPPSEGSIRQQGADAVRGRWQEQALGVGRRQEELCGLVAALRWWGEVRSS